jgi:uncharacterized protein
VTFAEVLAKYPRLVITGAPRTGKTSLALQVNDRPVLHTDDWMHLPWRELPDAVKVEAEKFTTFVLEGVRAADVIRNGLDVDAVVYLTDPKVEQTELQANMGKGVATVLAQWSALNPNVPIITEESLASQTQDRADLPRATRRYALSTLDYAGGNVERTPQGGLRIRARVSKAGVYDYNRSGRVLREYRPAEELKRPEAMASLKGSPIVVLHPRENGGAVDTENFKRLTVGHFEDPEWNEDAQAVDGWVVINDAETVSKIDSGELVEISCGYDNKRELEPGTSPDGKPYDLVQTDYVYNHIALGPPGWGRQGEEVALTLDSNDNQFAAAEPQKAEHMDPENTQLPAAAPVPATETKDAPPADAPESLSAGDVKALKELVAMMPKIVAMMAPAAPTTDEAPAGEKPAPTLDAKDVDRIAQEGVEVRTEAMSVMGDGYTTRGKSTREVKLDVIKSFDSQFSHEGESDEAISAAYRVALKAADDRAKNAKELGKTRALTTSDARNPAYKTIGEQIEDFQRGGA